MPRLGSNFPLVARSKEVEQLRTALERARSGTAGAVLVSGEAGVGKSRLLAEMADVARSAGAQVLVGRCVDINEASFPYLPFTDIAEQIRALSPEIITRRPQLATLAGVVPREPARPITETPTGNGTAHPDLDSGHAHVQRFDQLQLFDAVLGALNDLTQHGVVVLQIEDLHWSDPSTRDLLSFLFSRLGDQRLLIVASYRSDDLHRRHPFRPLLAELVRLPVVERLDLEPFRPADAEEFVRTLAKDSISEELITSVAARSEGNAFFAEELLEASSFGADGIPSVLADVLLARVEKLSPVAQRVVRAASVTGQWHVRHPTLDAVVELGAAELDTALREAIQHNILVPGMKDAYTFRHALLREAIYADLLPGERVRLHAAYAELLAGRDDPGMAAAIAYHSRHANDLPTALSASVRAVKEAWKKGAIGFALQHTERALELWDAVDDPESHAGTGELELTRKAAHAASSAGLPERALAFMRNAVPLADAREDPVLSADVRRQLAQALLANGNWTEAERVISEAWELIKDSPASSERAWVLALSARLTTSNSQRRSLAEAAAADARASGAASVEADTLISLSYCENRAGNSEEAASLLERAKQRAIEAGALDVELRARFNLIFGRFDQGQLEQAAQIADEAAQRAADVGLTWSAYGLNIRWLRSMTHYARGDWDAAADAAAPPGEPVSDVVTGLLMAAAALVQVGRGQFEQAERSLNELRTEWYRNENEQIALLAGIAGAELASWRSQYDDAVQVAEAAVKAIRVCSGEEWPMGGIRLATLALAAHADHVRPLGPAVAPGTIEEAVAAGEHLLERAEQTAVHGDVRAANMGPEGHAWLLRARAEHARLLGFSDPAPWRDVVEAFGYGDVYQQAIARWRLAEVLVSAGQRDDAATELAEALKVAVRLDAKPLGDALRSLARRARIAVPGAPVTSVKILTPRETSVLELVARGHTNRRIGEELYISEKTVSVHLSRVMAKLGAAGRTEAVAIAYQRGLLDETS
ncbi:helix-turn-helix transcriptional regulator [Phytoactinopolyspora mesophila]|uniref:helix-turn-helix transcriptional regulator n=1 Tax=Phytoactinopolyspora mesophila TaxID=2650750 RepID=UPI001C9E52B1